MITINQLKIREKIIDITILDKNIVYFTEDFNFLEKHFIHHIDYRGFPIYFGRKSFKKNIFLEINCGKMLEKNLSLDENMKIYAEIFGRSSIWNLPLKYFNIDKSFWKQKVRDVSEEIRLQAELGLGMLCNYELCFFRNIPKLNQNTLDKFCGMISSIYEYGNEMILYSGVQINFSQEIII